MFSRSFIVKNISNSLTYNVASSCVCERSEGVQGVLTLFCSGAAQVVCHALRVEELREQLEVEEEDGDRQEEEVEEKGRSRIKEMRP